MKPYALAILLIGAAVNCPADLLIYKYAGREQAIGPGHEISFNYSGQLFYDSSLTNGTFVGWDVIGGRKRYWIHPLTNHVLVNIQGKGTESYTVLAQASQNYDTNGYPHLRSYIFKGKDEQLDTGTGKQLTFPRVFTDHETDMTPYGPNNEMGFFTSTALYVFQPTITKHANDSEQIISDLVDALSQSLESKGYQKSN